ncbi:phosphate acyltransferase PlsX [Agaribacter marinus]|uniref:Phosphate acyltransferase n=1 Tax=Agaribacter marinus TaxID=1431249 RepID=A0AA37WJK8_9ALTE|nr:phosphate acyltransferase PlsX [Agaribacter marinus]GLR69905.1 phosphate acyltransferase [Agaribacter marinus]
MTKVIIALDIMGGDRGPHVFSSAVTKILSEFPFVHIVLCATESSANDLITKVPSHLRAQLSVEACEQVVDMQMKPAFALRKMKNSSMRRALDLVNNQLAHGCVSSGNTGALMAMANYVLKTLNGISRPALVSSLPTRKDKKVLLLDLGASINCDAENLLQYAVMGSVLQQSCGEVDSPKVALLNVGEEDIKGNSVIKHADALLKECAGLDYIGYVEGDDIFAGEVDVVVTDGFTGNIALKASEGIAKLVIEEIKSLTKETFVARCLSKFMLPLLKNLYQRMNPDQYNGASLIGLRGIVIKSHGNASAEACYYALKQAISEINLSVPDRIRTKIEKELLEH